jgi:hypothetical protein
VRTLNRIYELCACGGHVWVRVHTITVKEIDTFRILFYINQNIIDIVRIYGLFTICLSLYDSQQLLWYVALDHLYLQEVEEQKLKGILKNLVRILAISIIL